MSSKVAKLKNETAGDCNVNNIPDFNSNDEPVVTKCKGNACSSVNKTQSNVADVNSSEPKLLNKFASEKENLKYKIKTSIALDRLLRDTFYNTYKNKLFKNQTTSKYKFLYLISGCLRVTAK